MRRDVQQDDEEAVKVKEQSILELGNLLAKTGQAAGMFVFSFFVSLLEISFSELPPSLAESLLKPTQKSETCPF